MIEKKGKSIWSDIQAPEEMYILKEYDFDDDSQHLLSRWLGLERPNLKIVEMGSGSGYFTKQLLKTANHPSITCVEPDETQAEYAKKHLKGDITITKGFVENPPIPRDYADLVVCHYLLCNVPDLHAAVKGMMKVAKPGGIVCSIEPAMTGGFSSDPRARLIVEGHGANIEGAWIKRKENIQYPKEYPYNNFIYPRIFAESGLQNIEVRPLASCVYIGDWRWRDEDKRRVAEEWLDLLERHRERYEANLRRAGWVEDRIQKLFKAWREYYSNMARNPKETLEDHSVYMKCNIVTIGRKIEY